jgi:hypothetical protein
VSARSRCFPILLIALAVAPAFADGPLSPADAKYLDSLIPGVLFDPTGAERVRVRTGEPDRPRFRDGWLVKGSAGRPARVYFADGYWIPAPRKLERLDFRGQAEKLFDAVQPPDTNTEQWLRGIIGEVFGEDHDPVLALAAWYRRLGYDRFAAEALDVARALSPDPEAELRAALVDRTLLEITRALHFGDFAAVLAAGEHFARRYPENSDDELRSVTALVADARRRLRQYPLGIGPALDRPPDGSRLATVIASLDSVVTDFGHRREEGEPPPAFGRERLMQMLVRFGDPAVPALLDVLERDRRLTRITFDLDGWSRGGRFVPLVAVHDLAELALQEILGLQEFPAVAGETDEMPDNERAARRIRQYLKDHESLSRDERLMKRLADPAAHIRIEAAIKLGQGNGSWGRRPGGRPFEESTLRGWGESESTFLDALVRLGDHRVGPELVRRAAAAGDPDLRFRYARAAADLGAGAAWVRLARDAERGTIPLASGVTAQIEMPEPERREVELRRLVRGLIESNTPAAERALDAMTDPAHPYFPTARGALLAANSDAVWTTHPFCLSVLRRSLTDRRLTGETYAYQLRGNVVAGPSDRRTIANWPVEWEVEGRILDKAPERTCDTSAILLSDLVFGAPFYHPLCTDADARLAALTTFVDKYRWRARPMTESERSVLLDDRGLSVFIPVIKPLGRAATAADVKAGRAVFHLNGNGRVWAGAIPARVRVRSEPSSGRFSQGLVVQAEADADGKAVFGVIFRHELRMVRADEIEP